MPLTLLRQKIAFYLEDIETPLGRVINLTITGLVFLSSAIFVAETYALPEYVRINLNTVDFTILLLFAYEYFLRLWCAENRVKYIFSLYSLIDLVVILPYFLGVVDITFLRIFRWLRILRLLRFIENNKLFGYLSKEDSTISTRIIFTLFSIIFVYSGLIYQLEHQANNPAFTTFFDAFYFSVVTMTTVGFGDVTPISQGGRLMTVLMILTGIALIPWQLGDLIRRLVKNSDYPTRSTSDRIDKPCPKCGLSSHDIDAKFCKICGSKLDITEKLTADR